MLSVVLSILKFAVVVQSQPVRMPKMLYIRNNCKYSCTTTRFFFIKTILY